MPPEEPRKTRPLGQGAFDVRRGEMPPLLPGGVRRNKRKMKVKVYTTMLLVLVAQLTPAMALDGRGIGVQIADVVRGIINEIVAILTPIISVIGVGMVVIGLLLGLGLRQEYLGLRLAIGGALALATVYLVVPLLLGFI
jgi:hypothetical protein